MLIHVNIIVNINVNNIDNL